MGWKQRVWGDWGGTLQALVKNSSLPGYVSSHTVRPKLLFFKSSFRRGVDANGGKTPMVKTIDLSWYCNCWLSNIVISVTVGLWPGYPKWNLSAVYVLKLKSVMLKASLKQVPSQKRFRSVHPKINNIALSSCIWRYGFESLKKKGGLTLFPTSWLEGLPTGL